MPIIASLHNTVSTMEREGANSNNYEVNDIIVFRMLKRNVTGQVIDARFNRGWGSCHVRLISDVSCFIHFLSRKYAPIGEYKDKENWYEKNGEGINGEIVKLKVIYLEERKIKFSIKREDTGLFLQAKTSGEQFKYILRGLWKDLVVRKVKTVKVGSKNNPKPTTIYKHKMNDMNLINIDWSFQGSTIPDNIESDCFYAETYSHYFGFCRKFKGDNREIHFSRDNYMGIDFDIDSSCWFSRYGNHKGGYYPPYVNQFICGLVKEGDKGPFYERWFTCSDQFFNFWKFIMSDNVYTGNNTGHKYTSVAGNDRKISNLLDSVNTDIWEYGKNLTQEQRKGKLDVAKKMVRCFDYQNPGPYRYLIEYIVSNGETEPVPFVVEIVYSVCGIVCDGSEDEET